MTAKMKIMMHSTKVRLPRAPTVLPMMEMSKLSVGHDFANLKTRSCKYQKGSNSSPLMIYYLGAMYPEEQCAKLAKMHLHSLAI